MGQFIAELPYDIPLSTVTGSSYMRNFSNSDRIREAFQMPFYQICQITEDFSTGHKSKVIRRHAKAPRQIQDLVLDGFGKRLNTSSHFDPTVDLEVEISTETSRSFFQGERAMQQQLTGHRQHCSLHQGAFRNPQLFGF